MNEWILIVIMFMASLLIYALAKRFAGVRLNAFGLILIWPIVLAAVMRYSTVTKVVSFVLVFPAIYLLTRSVDRSRESEKG